MRVISRIAFVCLVLLLLCGCQTGSLGRWQGPDVAADSSTTDWGGLGEEKAKRLESRHYHIYTTIDDEEVLDLLPQVMEGAYTLYRQFAPAVQVDARSMDCYVFRARSEWDRYTQRYAGQDADIYLRIRSGGYTIRDRFVLYYIGRLGTFSVAAHEGWHQYAGRNFKGRLPPFLEEGIACMFETISWRDRLPRWNMAVNVPRAQTLRRIMDAGETLPLEELCGMHAGDIVGEAAEKIDGFYAQCWAFGRFLWDAEGGRYRPGLQLWLADTAAGTVYDPTSSHTRAALPWNRKAVKPMIEHYLGLPIDRIDQAYVRYMHKIAYDELSAQWRS